MSELVYEWVKKTEGDFTSALRKYCARKNYTDSIAWSDGISLNKFLHRKAKPKRV